MRCNPQSLLRQPHSPSESPAAHPKSAMRPSRSFLQVGAHSKYSVEQRQRRVWAPPRAPAAAQHNRPQRPGPAAADTFLVNGSMGSCRQGSGAAGRTGWNQDRASSSSRRPGGGSGAAAGPAGGAQPPIAPRRLAPATGAHSTPPAPARPPAPPSRPALTPSNWGGPDWGPQPSAFSSISGSTKGAPGIVCRAPSAAVMGWGCTGGCSTQQKQCPALGRPRSTHAQCAGP